MLKFTTRFASEQAVLRSQKPGINVSALSTFFPSRLWGFWAPSIMVPQTGTGFQHQDNTTRIIDQILQAKKLKVNTMLKRTWQRYSPILIGGDLFTFGYSAFEGIRALKPEVQTIAAVKIATLACGVIAGMIWIGVGVVCLVEAIQAIRNGDKLLGLRLMLDFLGCTAIGAVMILASFALKIGALGGIAAVLAANPWLLPVLFFIITLPLILELSYRIKNIAIAKDLGSQLKLETLQTLLEKNAQNWSQIEDLCATSPFHLKELQQRDPQELSKFLSKKMEGFQADIGVEAAVEVFHLLLEIQKKDKQQALNRLKLARKKIKEWNQSLYLRMFQQILYTAGFGVSMAALSPKVNANLLTGTENFCLGGANVIPLYMDIFWPFKRNTPIVVPKVEEKDIVSRS